MECLCAKKGILKGMTETQLISPDELKDNRLVIKTLSGGARIINKRHGVYLADSRELCLDDPVDVVIQGQTLSSEISFTWV